MKKQFKNVYDQITLSEEAKKKLLNLQPEEKKVKKYRMRYVAAAALVFGIYITSNLVTYAATGKSIAQHISNVITFDDNGDTKLKDGTEVHSRIEKDIPYEVDINEIKDEDGTGSGVQIDIHNKKK